MPKRRDGASVVRQVTQLAAYIDRDVNAQDRGDVVARGQLNLITDVRSEQVAEMAATAMGAPTARSPIEHLVLSWRAGEQPTVRQIEQGLAILLEETGLRGHQVLWTQHLGASGNAHVHALISRVAPDADKPTRVAFFHRAIGRAVARIEHVQGWQREPGAHHEVFEDRSIGEQHVDRYRTAGRPAPGLQPHRSLPGARGPHQHDRLLRIIREGSEEADPIGTIIDGQDRASSRLKQIMELLQAMSAEQQRQAGDLTVLRQQVGEIHLVLSRATLTRK
ncbi:relaxase/mobilization nuclease domain-containing protein [Methylobacterium komagatae]|uniref:Relaxase/mobilization nuclease domain-containing protein n=2 Tax=Methylobacterium komagatae TaxID=374425 RepID=A0ABW2BNZ8_9HYPH